MKNIYFKIIKKNILKVKKQHILKWKKIRMEKNIYKIKSILK